MVSLPVTSFLNLGERGDGDTDRVEENDREKNDDDRRDIDDIKPMNRHIASPSQHGSQMVAIVLSLIPIEQRGVYAEDEAADDVDMGVL
jgi:hypothetical protein